MLTETYSIRFEIHNEGEITCNLGDFAATGSTRETALQNLAQRIAGAPQEQRLNLWNAKGKGGSVATGKTG